MPGSTQRRGAGSSNRNQRSSQPEQSPNRHQVGLRGRRSGLPSTLASIRSMRRPEDGSRPAKSEICIMRRARSLIPLTIITIACGFAAPSLADDDDYPVWKPSSDTAVSVTGPIILLPDRLKAGQANFPWRPAGALAQFKPDQASIPTRVFEVADGTNPELLDGKRLCGDKAVGWISTLTAVSTNPRP